ncbi:DUF3109 family protein [Kordia sp.]|uniref:DUF3109 family protein n=1 Tax=Kordia sp. TaxID=1965332 RepID=UPI003D273A02
MFQLGKTIISEDILEKDFVCNLSACKGICCVAGDAGAPLEQNEIKKLDEIYDTVKPFLRKEGIHAIEKQGTYIVRDNGDLETPLVNDAECAYVTFDENQTAMCGIEQAYNKGLVDWKKPISCHLYPVRIEEYSDFAAVNYHKWQICDDACTLGKELQVPVYKFVKDALVRKFGEDWYSELEKTAQKLGR